MVLCGSGLWKENLSAVSHAALPTGHVTSVVEFDDDIRVVAMRTELMQPINRSTVS